MEKKLSTCCYAAVTYDEGSDRPKCGICRKITAVRRLHLRTEAVDTVTFPIAAETGVASA